MVENLLWEERRRNAEEAIHKRFVYTVISKRAWQKSLEKWFFRLNSTTYEIKLGNFRDNKTKLARLI